MKWSEIRKAYPNQWLVVEAIQAHTTPEKRRLLDTIAVVDRCDTGSAAMDRYGHMHRRYPSREFYFVHTSREELDIHEQVWFGIRRGCADTAER
ncbi:MAG: hypothetical protein MUD15_10420 [Desulfobacterota bacterium]|jgi:hypothetical protein|nr:hypothetical protein [Thermodesulfobacteriota bacterium]